MTNTAPTNKPSPTSAPPVGMALSEFERLLKMDAKSKVEFEPFGSSSKITLSVEIIRKYIAVPFLPRKENAEPMLPDDRQCMKFLMLCRSRALNPFEGDAFFIPFFDSQSGAPIWSLITSHQAFLKRGEVHPEYDGKRSGVIVNPQHCNCCDGRGRTDSGICLNCQGKGYWDEMEGDFVPEEINGEKVALLGGWCRIYFKGRHHPEYQRLKLSTYSKTFGQWAKDNAGMICKCAEAAAMRGAFPNTLGGLYLREEVQEDLAPATVVPKFGGAKPNMFTRGQSSPAPEPNGETDDKHPEDAAEEAAMGLRPANQPTRPEAKTSAPVAPAATATEPVKQNYLKTVRFLCKAGGFSEGLLLDLLATIGQTRGGFSTLEDIAMSQADALVWTHDHWEEVLVKLKGMAKR